MEYISIHEMEETEDQPCSKWRLEFFPFMFQEKQSLNQKSSLSIRNYFIRN
jgi:hypothetical protein